MTQNEQYLLRIIKSVRKEMADLQPKFYKQVMAKILLLQEQPFPQDCKPFLGYPGCYRVDQGEYRILYRVEEGIIEVFRVGKRNDDEVYENL